MKECGRKVIKGNFRLEKYVSLRSSVLMRQIIHHEASLCMCMSVECTLPCLCMHIIIRTYVSVRRNSHEKIVTTVCR